VPPCRWQDGLVHFSETSLLFAALAAAVTSSAWLAVALFQAGRSHRRALAEQGWLLERERAGSARAAVDAERARIARELHDIVSHTVSLMVVQAAAAREVLADAPDDAAAALGTVEDAGRSALTELRHLLGLLAPAADGEDETLAPQPGLARLSALIDRFAFTGLAVAVRISGEARPLPPGIDVTAYRIVQEALTNALKHGKGTEADVSVRYSDAALRVEVLTTGPSVLGTEPPSSHGERAVPGDAQAGAGHGLIGLRERVAVYGGDFDARRRLGGGFRVRARLPLGRP
jgi:signal transduction histidine kinase